MLGYACHCSEYYSSIKQIVSTNNTEFQDIRERKRAFNWAEEWGITGTLIFIPNK